jgi:hypothetical protein
MVAPRWLLSLFIVACLPIPTELNFLGDTNQNSVVAIKLFPRVLNSGPTMAKSSFSNFRFCLAMQFIEKHNRGIPLTRSLLLLMSPKFGSSQWFHRFITFRLAGGCDDPSEDEDETDATWIYLEALRNDPTDLEAMAALGRVYVESRGCHLLIPRPPAIPTCMRRISQET